MDVKRLILHGYFPLFTPIKYVALIPIYAVSSVTNESSVPFQCHILERALRHHAQFPPFYFGEDQKYALGTTFE